MIKIGVVLSLLTLSAFARADQQVNPGVFAYCLAQQAPAIHLDETRIRYNLGDTDLLLLYLSVYPGKRIPLLNGLLQKPADRKSTRLNSSH